MRCVPVGNCSGNLRHNYGVPPATGYVHRALDIFVPIGSPLLAPGDGQVIWSRDEDTGAGGFALRFQEDNGARWYCAHLLQGSLVPIGLHVKAGTRIGTCGWSGNAGLGNATVRGKRTEPHLHTEVRVQVGRTWYYADPWDAICQIWGLNVHQYRHDGIYMPATVYPVDIPVRLESPASGPGSSPASSPASPPATPQPASPAGPSGAVEAIKGDLVALGATLGYDIVSAARTFGVDVRNALKRGMETVEV